MGFASFSNLLGDPSLEALRDVAPVGRALSYATLAAATTIGVAALRSASARAGAGDGDAVVSVGNLGDHIRMLNVATRLEPSVPLHVIANDAAAPLVGLYADVRIEASGGRYGASFVAAAAKRLIARRPARFARALVAQPMVTQPQAIAEATTIAERSIVLGAGIVAGVDRIAFDERSWRTAYERFFSACYPNASFAPLPRIAPDLRWNGRGSRRIAIHTGGQGHVRGIDDSSFCDLAVRLIAREYEPCIVGTFAEGPALRASFPERCRFVLGASMRELARELAECAALVAIDSSVMNVADAVGLPCVIAYNRSDPAASGPFYVPLVAVHAEGARSLGTAPHGRWRQASKDRGRSPSGADLDGALQTLVTNAAGSLTLGHSA
jgi:hypothetical protein